MYRILSVLFFLLFLLPVYPQDDVDSQIIKGLEYSNNFQWEKSEEIYNKITAKYPDDPRGWFFKARNSAWAYLSNKSQADYNEFFRLCDLALSKSEKRADNNSKDETALFITGMAYNYRAVVYGKAESYVNAVWALKKTNSYLRTLVATDKNFCDAYLGLGIYNLALSEIPSSFKWVLSAAGISGDKNTGLSCLRKAAKGAKFLKAESQYYLSQIYTDNLLNYSAAAGQLRPIIAQYPQNSLFLYSYATLLMKQKKLQEAENYLNKVIKTDTNQKFRQVASYAYFSLGDIYFRQNQFAKAAECYHKFLKSNSFREYTGIVNLRLGYSYEFAGKRSYAVKCFEAAQNGNQKFEEDVYAKRKGETFAKRTIAETEEKVIRGANCVEAGNYAEAISILNDALRQAKTERLKAEAYLHLSDALYETGKYSESLGCAQKIRDLNPEGEKWILPFALFNEARNYYKMGEQGKAKEALNQAGKENSHDFEKKLNLMVNNLTRSINH